MFEVEINQLKESKGRQEWARGGGGVGWGWGSIQG